jgi:hypothetical protein
MINNTTNKCYIDSENKQSTNECNQNNDNIFKNVLPSTKKNKRYKIKLSNPKQIINIVQQNESMHIEDDLIGPWDNIK